MPENVDITQMVTLPDMSVWQQSAKGANAFADGEDRAAAAAQRAVGPLQRLIGLQRQYAAELNRTGGIDPARQFDLQHAVQQQQARVQRIQKAQTPQSFGQRAGQFLASTRFGGGGGLGGMMPLVGRAANLALGAEGAAAFMTAAGPIALVAAAAIAAAKALYETAARAAELGKEFSSIRFGTGASTSQAGKLSALSKTFGIDTTSLSKSLDDRITSDPMAMATASAAGIRNIKAPFGSPDIAQNLIQAITALRKISDPQERIRTAKMWGIEQALPMTQVSNNTFGRIQGDAQTTSKIFNPQFEAQSAEFNAAVGRVKVGWDNMSAAFGEKFFPVIIPFLSAVAEGEESIAALLNGDFMGSLKHGANMLQDKTQSQFNMGLRMTGGGVGGWVADKIPGLKGFAAGNTLKGFGDDGGGMSDATSANTKALWANHAELTRLNKQIGGGERAANAMPGSMGGADNWRLAEVGALRLGALG